MNNLEFDHGDIFRDLQDISRSFSHLLRIVPSDGFVLRNGDDPNLLALPDATWTRIISVGVGENNEFRITDFTEDEHGSRFGLSWKGEPVIQVDWRMPGLFNARNLAMAILATGLSQQIAKADGVFDLLSGNPFSGVSMPDFSGCAGVKRRQEILHNKEELVVISDFAHHPTAIAGALESLRARWPDCRILACFEPRSNTAVTNVFEDRFADALALADIALLGAVHRAEKIPKDQRINTSNMIQRILLKLASLTEAKGNKLSMKLALPSILMRSWNTSFLVFDFSKISNPCGLFLKWFLRRSDRSLCRITIRTPVLKD